MSLNLTTFKVWFKAVRPFAYPASIIPVLLGVLLAFLDGHFNPVTALMTLAGVMLLHTGTNLTNDYHDYRNGVDVAAGGNGVLVEKLLEPAQVHRASLLSFALAVPLGICLTKLQGLPVAVMGAAGMAGGYFYTAGPVAYKYRGWGVPAVFILMGPLIVAASYYVQAGRYNPGVLAASLPVGFMVAAILHANEYRDADLDRRFGFTTPAALLGRRRARLLYYLLLSGAYLSTAGLAAAGITGPWVLLVFLTLPFSFRLAGIVETAARGGESPRLYVLDVLTARLHLLFGFLLITGAFLGTFP